MRSIGMRELKQRTSQVLRQLQERGKGIEVTHRGRVVARLVPVGRAPARRRTGAAWSTLEELAREIGARWPKGPSATVAVREGRRDV